MEEILEALDSRRAGGQGSLPRRQQHCAWLLAKALFTAREHGWHRFVSVQNHYNLIYREDEREVIPLCIDQGVGADSLAAAGAGFSDLQSRSQRQGAAPARGKRSIGPAYRDDDYEAVDAVAKVAAARGVGPARGRAGLAIAGARG